MSPAPAVTNILEMTQLSPQFKFCKEQFITLRLKVRIKVENLEDEIWWQLISLLCNLHESSVKSYDFLNRNNPCHTVCSMCNFLSPVYFDLQGFKVAYIIFKKAASLEKVKSHPYDKVLRLSPEENPILTGIKSMFTMILKRAWLSNTDSLKKKFKREK